MVAEREAGMSTPTFLGRYHVDPSGAAVPTLPIVTVAPSHAGDLVLFIAGDGYGWGNALTSVTDDSGATWTEVFTGEVGGSADLTLFYTTLTTDLPAGASITGIAAAAWQQGQAVAFNLGRGTIDNVGSPFGIDDGVDQQVTCTVSAGDERVVGIAVTQWNQLNTESGFTNCYWYFDGDPANPNDGSAPGTMGNANSTIRIDYEDHVPSGTATYDAIAPQDPTTFTTPFMALIVLSANVAYAPPEPNWIARAMSY
jgi:hypothetical protein